MNTVSVVRLESPLGPLVAGATADGVCLLEFTDERRYDNQLATVARRLDAAIVPGSGPHLDHLQAELEEYFAARRRAFTVPLLSPGTEFEERVWGELRRIPYGETRSYEDLARTLGRPNAQRAVGTANGRNRISIVIPCHRVVNKSGKLGGYGGGLWRKQALLDLERGGQLLLCPQIPGPAPH
jgi:AraC family transcriptional regulator of adaptative response/methylated-DNA-[protein]-cysteine methyltransferase